MFCNTLSYFAHHHHNSLVAIFCYFALKLNEQSCQSQRQVKRTQATTTMNDDIVTMTQGPLDAYAYCGYSAEFAYSA